MWNYDKLFAEGNVVGIKYIDYIGNHIVPQKTRWGIDNEDWKNFWNDKLESGAAEIQYIIRLDEHGNVIEKLFDREKDMSKPMPELETGMFVRVKDEGLGYVDTINNRIVYQLGGYDNINGESGVISDIIEVYEKESCSFNGCMADKPIWRFLDHQVYLDSRN